MANLFIKTINLYKEAWKGHPREIWALTILTFINRMGTLVLPFCAVYLTTELHFSLKDTGYLMLSYGLGSFSGSWLGGKATDKLGAQAVIVLSLMSGGVMFFLLQFMTSFWGFFGVMYVAATLGEAYRPAMSVAAAERVPKSQMGRTTSLLRLAINLGMAAGPTIGGFIAVAWGYSWLFTLDGATCVLGALFFLLISLTWRTQKRKTETEAEPVSEEPASTAKGPPPWKNLTFLLFLLSTLLLSFAFMQAMHILPVFIKQDWNFDERYLGILFGFSCTLVVLIEMPVIHWFEQKKKIKFAYVLGAALIGGSYLVYFLPGHLALCFVGFGIWTLGEIFALPFNNSIAINLSPDNRRGQYMSWYFMTWSLANIVGPLVSFSLADHLGFEFVFLLNVVLAGVALFIFWTISSKVVDSDGNE